eukprot:CAMPEP_0168536258 /NCGR_PEP_ID=MMETSP0405-20121227/19410_1 /TAXON_ID=498012 /ORGANISM="Trichosphaerium sp, Strain Am-I-7 wt" /LENGTH=36 /DNA_ID= /DNA_START= /DNA_END= /DNA_ORIENTATION=
MKKAAKASKAPIPLTIAVNISKILCDELENAAAGHE